MGSAGAVRLLAHDAASRTMLIERCVPGTPLGTSYDDEALAVIAATLRQLWGAPVSGSTAWHRIDQAAERWSEYIAERYDGRLRAAALDAVRALVPSLGELVLCHGDLHGGNVLRAERRPWLAIDSKPVVAEAEYDTVAAVRDARPSVEELARRLGALAALLDMDRERMRLWGLVKSLAWDNVEDARLFFEIGSR